jgi:hypothetical protein
MEEQEYLKLLIRQLVINTNISINTTIPINEVNEDKTITTIATVIWFSEYSLVIDNPHKVTQDGNPEKLDILIGLRVIDAVEGKESAKILFTDNVLLEIDMRDEAYTGPEAMSLNGPDNFCAVWN